MKTAEEQLIEVRVAYIKNLYKGQRESVIKLATGNVAYMNFSSVEDFESWANDQFKTDPFVKHEAEPSKEASEEDLEQIFDYMGLGLSTQKSEPDKRTQNQKDIDDILKYI